MTECAKDCGACCNPVIMTMQQVHFLRGWANRPDPKENQGGLPAFVIETPEALEKAREHIANGTFMERHWIFNIRWVRKMASGLQLVGFNCPFFNESTKDCEAYDRRPPICRNYPFYGRDPSEVAEASVGLQMPLKCSYWADVPLGKRPEGWKPPEK